jgi:hypothetical protein
VGSFVVPIDAGDRGTWADGEHRLAQISETTVIYKDVVAVRDEQWWRAVRRGFVTQWSAMRPKERIVDAIVYAHSPRDVADLAPLVQRFRAAKRAALLAVPGGHLCPCETAAARLRWPPSVCRERRFKILDLDLGSVAAASSSSSSIASDVSIVQEIYAAFKGLIAIHAPALVIVAASASASASDGGGGFTRAAIPDAVRDGIALAVSKHAGSTTSLVLLPRDSVPHVLWLANLRPDSLRGKPRFACLIALTPNLFLLAKSGASSLIHGPIDRSNRSDSMHRR